MVVVEAAARATPSIVVAGEDNAAIELIEEGVNGVSPGRRPRGDRRCDRARSTRPAWRCAQSTAGGSRERRAAVARVLAGDRAGELLASGPRPMRRRGKHSVVDAAHALEEQLGGEAGREALVRRRRQPSALALVAGEIEQRRRELSRGPRTGTTTPASADDLGVTGTIGERTRRAAGSHRLQEGDRLTLTQRREHEDVGGRQQAGKVAAVPEDAPASPARASASPGHAAGRRRQSAASAGRPARRARVRRVISGQRVLALLELGEVERNDARRGRGRGRAGHGAIGSGAPWGVEPCCGPRRAARASARRDRRPSSSRSVSELHKVSRAERSPPPYPAGHPQPLALSPAEQVKAVADGHRRAPAQQRQREHRGDVAVGLEQLELPGGERDPRPAARIEVPP